MGPIDYSINVQSPFTRALQGYQAGAAIRDDIAGQEAKRAAQVAQQQAAEQQNRALNELLNNPAPTADDYARATVLVPGMREQFKQSWEMRDSEQQKASLTQISQVHAALSGGQPQFAVELLNRHADALEASKGKAEDIKAARTMASVIEQNPAFAKVMTGMKLASIPGGDKVFANLSAIGAEDRAAAKAPAELTKLTGEAAAAQYGAQVKAVEAGNAQTAAVLGNQTKAEEIKSAVLKRDLDRIDAQIKAANSETDRQRLQLERDKLTATQSEKTTAATTGAQDALDGLTQAMSTVKSVMDHPGLKKGTGLGGDAMAWINGSDAADFRAQLGVLKSQQFLTNIGQMKGTGAITDVEGKKLESAVASLETSQSASQFKAALGTIKATLEKAQNKLAQSGRLPTTGGAFVMTHPVFGQVTDGQVNALMKQHPGATREQVIQFLKQSGGK
jgi:hypothetical protein